MEETKKGVSMVQICDKCGGINYDNVNFCQGCGRMLKDFDYVFCKICRTKNSIENKVCYECKNIL